MSYLSAIIGDFSKGLDLVSSLQGIAPGYTPNAMNMRVSEYGGVEKVLGYSAFADLGADEGHDAFYFQKASGSTKRLIVATATKWFAIEEDGDETAIRTGMTSTTDTTFVAVDDVLYGLDANNNMASWDGTTLTTHAPGVDTGPPRGTILGVWNARMYVAPADDPMKVVWSEPGVYAGVGSWPADNAITLAAPSSSDKIIAGQPMADGIVVFCRASTFTIYSSLDGKNRLVDAERGLASRRSLVVRDGYVYGVSVDGVFRTTGAFALEIVSRAIEPLFAEAGSSFAAAAGGRYRRAVLFSYGRAGGDNDLTLDYFPNGEDVGSWMANAYPMAACATAEFGADEELYFIDASDPTKVRKAFDGGAFVDQPIPCYYELAPDALGNESQLKRLHRVRVVGRGDLYISARADYESVNRDVDRFAFPVSAAGEWDVMDWDEGQWAGYQLLEGWVRLRARGRRIQLRIYETGENASPARDNLGSSSSSGELGGAAVYQIEAHYAVSSRYR